MYLHLTAVGNMRRTSGLSPWKDCTIRKTGSGYAMIYLQDARPTGVVIINTKVDLGAFHSAFEKKTPVSRLKEILLSVSFSYTHLHSFLRGK